MNPAPPATADALTAEERATYEWQMWLPELGEEAQRRLKGATALVSRVGGVGGAVAQQLAAAGVGRLILAHGGVLKPSDLNRQILMFHAGLGLPRVKQAARRLREINPRLRITEVSENLSGANALRWAREADVVVDCAPRFEERLAMNRAAMEAGKPMVECAMFEWEGHVAVFPPGGPCLACLHPEPPPAWKRQFPVLGAVAAVVGAWGAVEAVRLLAGLESPLAGRMLRIDFRAPSTRVIQLKRREDCAVCGARP